MCQLFPSAEQPAGTGFVCCRISSAHDWLADWKEGNCHNTNVDHKCKYNQERTSIPWETDLFYVELYLINFPYVITFQVATKATKSEHEEDFHFIASKGFTGPLGGISSVIEVHPSLNNL